MNHVFGPLPTRRLGRSLGIDTVPLKTCNWNCAYCQLGRSRPVTTERREYFPVAAILAEVAERLGQLEGEGIDWITFVGSGEGTLHRGIGELIGAVKRLARHPVAVITNGSLLYRAEVRAALAAADAVLPTLDAGDATLYRRLNRPHRSLSFAQHVAGLEAFARLKSRGKLWVEVMLVAGMNDTEPALRRLAEVLKRIGPDEVHLTQPTRCPAAAWVRPPDTAGVARARDILGARVPLGSTDAETPPARAAANLDEQILAVVTRHPWRRSELPRLFAGAGLAAIAHAVDSLLAAGRAQIVGRFGAEFVAAAAGRYEATSAPGPATSDGCVQQPLHRDVPLSIDPVQANRPDQRIRITRPPGRLPMGRAGISAPRAS